MSDKFQVTYYVDDGYANPGPKHLSIHASDLDEYMDVEDLLDAEVQNAFDQDVHPYVKDEQRMEFVLASDIDAHEGLKKSFEANKKISAEPEAVCR